MKASVRVFVALSTFALCASAFAGQTWRWKEGAFWVYGDKFPNGAVSPELVVAGSPDTAVPIVAKSFSNEQASKQFPVVVYGLSCPACDAAKKLLESRKINAVYKDPSTPEVFEEFKKYSPKAMAPVVLIGDKPFVGFEPAALNGALDDAGYEKAQPLSPVPSVK
jgi:glutaredoxin